MILQRFHLLAYRGGGNVQLLSSGTEGLVPRDNLEST
jgi:hypothetical protein